MKTAEDIVRALAACTAPLDYEYGDCMLCYASGKHHENCPWAMAAAWTAREAARVQRIMGSIAELRKLEDEHGTAGTVAFLLGIPVEEVLRASGREEET